MRECVALINVDGRECYLGVLFAYWDGSWYAVNSNPLSLRYQNLNALNKGVVFPDDVKR